jgi:hypothetical protein
MNPKSIEGRAFSIKAASLGAATHHYPRFPAQRHIPVVDS